MKKILLLLIILLLSGCSDYIEINELGIVTGIALDYKDDMFNVSTQMIIDEKEKNIEVYNTSSQTIDEALNEISKISNKVVFISHLKVLILSESIVEQNINYYDFFLRSSKSKMNFNIFITDEDPVKILNTYNNEISSALYIDDTIKFNEKIFSSSSQVEFIDIVHDKLEKGLDEVYPKIIVKNNNEKKSLYLDNLVAVGKNNTLELSEKESILYNIIKNNSKKTLLDIKCDDNTYSLEINDSKSKYEFNNNTFIINIDYKTSISNYKCKYDLKEKENVKKLEEISEKYLTEEISNLIKLSKEKEIDFLGIGNHLYKYHPDYFDFDNLGWYENLKSLEINANNKVHITSTGEIKKGIKQKNENK